MVEFSSEAKKAGLQGPQVPVDALTEDELKLFRKSFDPDMMGFDGAEGIDGEDDGEGGDGDGSSETGN